MMPIIKGLEQGTPEWLKYRRQHVMATDASVIMGVNPWTTEIELWEEKCGYREPKAVNEAMRRGQLLEDEARKLFIERTGINMTPCVYESDKHPWAAASLDGMSDCGQYILELKCPGITTHNDFLLGTIKEYYLMQMNHQLFVTDLKVCYYASYNPDHEMKFTYTEYRPIRQHYEASMIEKEKLFYGYMCSGERPPEPWKLKGK